MVKLILSKKAKQTPCKKDTTGKFFEFFFCNVESLFKKY